MAAIVTETTAAHSPSALEWIAYLAPSVAAVLGGIWIMVHVARHGRGDDAGESGGDGGGGGGSPKPPDPRPRPDPDWWPEFERQFAAYVRSGAQPTRVKTARAQPTRVKTAPSDMRTSSAADAIAGGA